MSKMTRTRKENPPTKPSQSKSQIRRRLSGSDLDDDDGIFILKASKPRTATAKLGPGASLEEPEAGFSKHSKPPKKRSRSRSRTRSVSPGIISEPVGEIAQAMKPENQLEKEVELELPGPPWEEPKDKVVCPFCWKKLSDKLSGMAHVKSCGKNLPTERIFDALQLQEKQVKEWAELGIDYPGFQNPSVGARAGKAVRGARNRKKKVDPELELALALSESLHEEIENRRRASDEYLVKIGLQNEVSENNHPAPMALPLPPLPKPPLPSSFRIRFGNQGKPKLTKQQESSASDLGAATTARTRKGKTKLTETRLFTVTDTEREMMLCEKVGQILEESERENIDREEKYKLDDCEVPLGVSDCLEVYRDEACKLWKMASSDITARNELSELLMKPTEIQGFIKHQDCEPMDQSTQTQKRKLVDQSTQTDSLDLIETAVQTETRKLVDGCVQTECKNQVCESIQTKNEFMESKNVTLSEPQKDKFEWNNESDDSVILFEDVDTSSTGFERRSPSPRRQDFSRSPSLSFGRSSSPEENSPPPSPTPTEHISVTSFYNKLNASTAVSITGYSSLKSPMTSASASTKVSPPRRSLSSEFSRAVHRTPPRVYSYNNAIDTPTQEPADDDIDWGNDDSVFIQVPDHVLLDARSSDSDLGSIPSEGNEKSTGASSDTLKALTTCKIPKKEKKALKSLLQPNQRSSPSHSFTRGSPQPMVINSSVLKVPQSKPSSVMQKMYSSSQERQLGIAENLSPPTPRYNYDQSPFRVDTDNFDWGNDTAIFDSIPDIIDSNIPTATLAYNHRRSSSSPSFNRSNSPVNKRKPGKPKTVKEKVKPGAKMKLPKKLGLPKESDAHKSKRLPRSSSLSQPLQDNSSNNSTPPNPRRPSLTQGYNPAPDHTPMLNYSCIDTPILKAELKKYGLKPLPRTKAKKLLRHIYTETHK